MDDAVERFGRPMAVKVDVEGGELDVLRGASGLLAADSTTFVLEIHSNEAGRDCRRLLENQGYECLEVDEPGRAETHLIARPARGT